MEAHDWGEEGVEDKGKREKEDNFSLHHRSLNRIGLPIICQIMLNVFASLIWDRELKIQKYFLNINHYEIVQIFYNYFSFKLFSLCHEFMANSIIFGRNIIIPSNYLF
ncbi:hypothetical protein ACJX0J_027841 [Zea mays]